MDLSEHTKLENRAFDVMKSIELCENRLRTYHDTVTWEDQKPNTEAYLFEKRSWYITNIETYENRRKALYRRYQELTKQMKDD